MRAGDTIRAATQNLGRRKVRTVLTSIGVFVGILTIVTMVSLGVGIQKQITDAIEAFGLQTVFISPKVDRPPTGSTTSATRLRPDVPITPDSVQKLAALPGVKSVDVTLSLPDVPEMTLTIDGKTFPIALVTVNPLQRIFTRSIAPVAGTTPPLTPDARGIALSPRLLRGAGFAAGQQPGVVGKSATLTVTAPRGDKTTLQTTIVGVVDTVGRAGAQLGNADAADLKKWWYNDPNIIQTDGYTSAVLHTASIGDASRVAQQVTGDFGFETTTLETFLDQVNRIFSILQVMLSSVGLLALAVASIGIINTMIMAIYERTREIGILKALGSSNGDILRMFMVEAGLIGLLGGIVGVVGGWALGLLLNVIIDAYLKHEQLALPVSGPFFVVTPELVAGALVFATLVGILAGLYPAFRAARLDPLAALRHE